MQEQEDRQSGVGLATGNPFSLTRPRGEVGGGRGEVYVSRVYRVEVETPSKTDFRRVSKSNILFSARSDGARSFPGP